MTKIFSAIYWSIWAIFSLMLLLDGAVWSFVYVAIVAVAIFLYVTFFCRVFNGTLAVLFRFMR